MEKTEAKFLRVLSLAARLVVWGGLFLVLYILRAFFLLMFLTFVFSYIQAHAVQRLKPYIHFRPWRVICVGIAFVSILVAVFMFLAPHIKKQANNTIAHAPEYFQAMDRQILELAADSRAISFAFGLKPCDEEQVCLTSDAQWQPDKSPTVKLLQSLIGSEDKDETNNESIKYVTGHLTKFGSAVLGSISSLLLAVLFSFLIVLDLPGLTRSVKDLAHTKVAFIYQEVAGSIAGFGRELGRAFEAQSMIAVLNTALTAIGLWLLGITNQTAFLSMIVFFCSFIPIAGVFISSIPICLIALQQGGISLLLLAALLITCIHLIEAYILNPRIYGSHMHMNPVLALFVLTIGGKVFGIWGFLLGMPVCTYVFKHAIRYEKQE